MYNTYTNRIWCRYVVMFVLLQQQSRAFFKSNGSNAFRHPAVAVAQAFESGLVLLLVLRTTQGRGVDRIRSDLNRNRNRQNGTMFFTVKTSAKHRPDLRVPS